ncbi:MAG: hypothetical protein GXP47_07135 [Acidobacteria bacterium]|nr:hypothetical protein [Acidobacteriota bacterium]
MIRRILAVAGAALLAAFLAGAAEPPATPPPTPTPEAGTFVGVAERPEGKPIFFRWLDKSDPVDATILEYWDRYEAGRLSPREMVDLGTMLFERGWPKDAIRLYKEAGEQDPVLYDAWLRAGLVAHSEHRLGEAKKYYKKCLKVLVGNGWCNFYLGLAEEQTFNGSAALKYYRKAFKVAPDLADPRANPAILESHIARAAALVTENQSQFVSAMPMSYLEPEEVERTRATFENRQRKIERWKAQAAGTGQGSSQPRTAPGGSVRAGQPPVHPSPVAHPKRSPPMSSPMVSPRAVPHPQPGVSSRHGMPTAKGTGQPPAPPSTDSRKVYPWGGGPLPPPVAPGQKPVARTPAPKATPVPEKK